MIAPMNANPIRAARHAPSQSGGSGGSFMLVGSGWLGVARGDMGKMPDPPRGVKIFFDYFRFPRFYAGCRAKKPENRPRTAPWPGNTGNKPSYGVTHWF